MYLIIKKLKSFGLSKDLERIFFFFKKRREINLSRHYDLFSRSREAMMFAFRSRICSTRMEPIFIGAGTFI